MNTKLEVLNSAITQLTKANAISKGALGALLGDKAELIIRDLIQGELASPNQRGYDVVHKLTGLKYEVKLRRQSVKSCNIEKSKLGKFDVAILIWYDETTLQPIKAFVLPHGAVIEHFNGARACINQTICQQKGVDVAQILQKVW